MNIEEIIEAPEAEETPQDAPPVKVHWEATWNHERNRAQWSRIEETGEVLDVEPKVVETPKPNRASRRRFKAVIARLIRRAQFRQAKAQPKTCSQCAAPFVGMHMPIYATNEAGEATETMRATVFWQCQCQAKVDTKPNTAGEEEAAQAKAS